MKKSNRITSLFLSSVSCGLILVSKHHQVDAFASPAASVKKTGAISNIHSAASALATKSTRLFHMGHSNSRHQHDDHDDSLKTPSSKNTKIQTPAQKQQRQTRRIALWIFGWFATCGSSLWRKGSISKSDWLAFGITSLTLSSVDKIRRSLRKSVDKFARFKDGIVKHAPNNDNSSFSSTLLQEQAREADRVTWIGVVINLFLSIGKLFFGITQHSSALIADAGHSLSDLVSDFITLWTVKIARLPADEDHPYGHWKFEAIGSLFLSLTLIATAFSIGIMSNKQLLQILSTSSSSRATSSLPMVIPGKLALVMAGISIASKEWLYRITKKVGEKIRSQVVIANAWHHRSDAYSSVLALASIAWARTGVPAADAAAGLLVAGMIGMTGGEILMESVQQLSDGANPSLQLKCEQDCQALLEKDPDDVEEVTSIKARQVGSLSLVEIQLTCPMHLSTTAARAVEERWKYWLKEDYGYEATVHAKPDVLLCPLLLAMTDTAEPSDSAAVTASTTAASVAASLTSAGSIEYLTRQQALLSCSSSSQVDRVTVHYHAGCQTSVDVMLSEIHQRTARQPATKTTTTTDKEDSIGSGGGGSTQLVVDLMEQGQKLKDSLQELEEIDQANIYWDLTSPISVGSAATTTATTSTMSTTESKTK